MKKIFVTIISIILILSMCCTNAFAYTTVPNTGSNLYDTYTVEVGVTRTIVGRSTTAISSDLDFMVLTVLGTVKNSSPTQKSIAVGIADGNYQTHEYKITTTRSGYTNTKLASLSTTLYSWQAVAKVDSINSYFAGAMNYSNSVTSTVSVRTRTGLSQGYVAYPSITVDS